MFRRIFHAFRCTPSRSCKGNSVALCKHGNKTTNNRCFTYAWSASNDREIALDCHNERFSLFIGKLYVVMFFSLFNKLFNIGRDIIIRFGMRKRKNFMRNKQLLVVHGARPNAGFIPKNILCQNSRFSSPSEHFIKRIFDIFVWKFKRFRCLFNEFIARDCYAALFRSTFVLIINDTVRLPIVRIHRKTKFLGDEIRLLKANAFYTMTKLS